MTPETADGQQEDFDSEEHEVMPDSPWTIEAIDGEPDDIDMTVAVSSSSRY
jgi:hypothetical protein